MDKFSKIALLFIIFSIQMAHLGYCKPMQGTYTIGPKPSDYLAIMDAVYDLYTRSISGSVVFNIKDGVYEEQVYIPYFLGTSATNTVTFQSLSGDSSKVIIRYTPTTEDTNYTMKIDGANYLIFKKLTFTTEWSGGRVVEIGQGSYYAQFLNNQFIGFPYGAEVVYENPFSYYSTNNTIITNNLFLYGSTGLSLTGPDTSTGVFAQGMKITGNIFKDQTASAISMNICTAFDINKNTITTNYADTSFLGISTDYCPNNFTIRKNSIIINNAAFNSRGIKMSEDTASMGKEPVISNNFVSINSQNYVAGIEILGYYEKIYNNSVNITGSNTGSMAFSLTIGNNIKIIDNIFSNQSGGFAFYINDTTANYSNYNDLYSNGLNLGIMNTSNITDLLSWQNTFKNDKNSYSINPFFRSSTDLHINNIILDNAGKSLPEVTDDIDGQARSKTTPDIGADEFSFVFDLGKDQTICTGDTLYLDASPGFSSYSWNTGGNTETIPVYLAKYGLGSKKYKVTATYKTVKYTDSVNVNIVQYNSFVGQNVYICSGDSDTITAYSGVNYLWNNGANTNSIVVKPKVKTTYSVIVTDKSNCMGKDTFIVYVNPLPHTPLDNIPVCSGDSAVIIAVNGVRFLWNTSDTTQQIVVKPKAKITYFVLVTDKNNCKAEDTFIVIVNPIPLTPSVIAVINDSLKCSIKGNYYDWLLNGAPVTQHTQTIYPTQSGMYSVIVYVNNCKSDTSSGFNFIYNSIENNTKDIIHIYPNPTNDVLLVDNKDHKSRYRLELITVEGKLMIETNWIYDNYIMNIKTFQKGMYLLKVITDQGSSINKVIIN